MTQIKKTFVWKIFFLHESDSKSIAEKKERYSKVMPSHQNSTTRKSIYIYNIISYRLLCTILKIRGHCTDTDTCWHYTPIFKMPLGNVIVLHYYITLYRCVNKISIVERERGRLLLLLTASPLPSPLALGRQHHNWPFFTLLYHIDVVIIVFV